MDAQTDGTEGTYVRTYVRINDCKETSAALVIIDDVVPESISILNGFAFGFPKQTFISPNTMGATNTVFTFFLRGARMSTSA